METIYEIAIEAGDSSIGWSARSSSFADRALGSSRPIWGLAKKGVDWPKFLGPTGNSKSTETGLITHWPADGPRLVWQMKLGTGYCTTAISRGRAFVFDRVGKECRLRCVESETAKPIWESTYPTDYEDNFSYDTGPRSSPVVDEDRVYTFGPEGMLRCVNVVDGKELWKIDTADKFHVIQNFFGVGSTPVVEGDLLIVVIGGSPADSHPIAADRLDQVKGNGCGIVAFDKRTGAVKYKITDELAAYASPTLATIGGRRWCFVLARGGLVAFEPSTGKIDFQYPWRAKDLYSVNASTPVVTGDTVFISESYEIGSSLLKVRPGGIRRVVERPGEHSRRESDAVALEYADRDRRLSLRLDRPAYRSGRVAGDRIGHRKSEMDAARLGPLLAALRRRPFRVARRKRPRAIAESEPREIQRRGRLRAERQRSPASRRHRSARTAAIPSLGSAHHFARTAICPREGSVGLL